MTTNKMRNISTEEEQILKDLQKLKRKQKNTQKQTNGNTVVLIQI